MRQTPSQLPGTLCTAFRVRRRDGVVLGFSDHDTDFSIDGITYEASSGFLSSAVEVSTGPEPDTQDIDAVFGPGEGGLSSDTITRTDLLGGAWDEARIDVALVDWSNPPASFDDSEDSLIWLKTLIMGRLEEDGVQFRAELIDILSYLSVPTGITTSQFCRAKLGDAKCGVDLGPLTVATTIAGVPGDDVITATALASPNGTFDGGLVRFSDGNMKGRALRISAQKGDTLYLQSPSPMVLQAGDSITVEPGCDKAISTCSFKFNNVANFRGEPYLPGADRFIGGLQGAKK